jgi:hypothetical protein
MTSRLSLQIGKRNKLKVADQWCLYKLQNLLLKIARIDGNGSKRQPSSFCFNYEGYPASLEVGKLYRVVADEQVEAHGLIRVIDESGKDYAFSRDRFYPI